MAQKQRRTLTAEELDWRARIDAAVSGLSFDQIPNVFRPLHLVLDETLDTLMNNRITPTQANAVSREVGRALRAVKAAMAEGPTPRAAQVPRTPPRG